MESKKSIVFLCGLLCKKFVWEDVAKNFVENFNILIISFEDCSSIEMMAKKVLSISPSEFILIGHSMGGRVALEVIRQDSKRVLALGLFNTGIHAKTEKEIPGRMKLLELAKSEGISAVSKVWLPPMMAKSSLKNKVLMDKLYEMINTYSIESFTNQINALINRPNASEILALLDIPVLLLSAIEDKWSPISQHEKMQEKLKISTLSVVEDASHMAPVEQPKIVASFIMDWLNLNK